MYIIIIPIHHELPKKYKYKYNVKSSVGIVGATGSGKTTARYNFRITKC